MEPRDEGHQHRTNPDRMDKWLDAALHEYGSAEPRIGLEGRILANLAAEKARGGVRLRWWALRAATAAACVGIVVWVGGVNHRSSVGNVAGNTSSAGQKARVANAQAAAKGPAVEAVRRPTQPRAVTKIEVAAEPRLGRFPSARPLSEQEQLLVRYVEESPSEAVLVAKEQAERRKELEKMAENESSEQDSDQ